MGCAVATSTRRTNQDDVDLLDDNQGHCVARPKYLFHSAVVCAVALAVLLVARDEQVGKDVAHKPKDGHADQAANPAQGSHRACKPKGTGTITGALV